MRKILSSAFLSLMLLSCSVTEKPEFIKVNSIDITDTSLKNFTVQAKLQFKNKNSVGGTLQAKDIHIFMDSIDLATVTTKAFEVPKKSEFEIPLEAVIPFEKVFNDNKQSLLNNIMNVISSKKVKLNYKGTVQYKIGVFHYDYPVDYTQEVSLKKN